MQIDKLKWGDFKSFEGEHSFDFHSYAPGLYFVRGVNKAEPELGANGAGKSTIWDVLHWCLFGKSMRELASTVLVPDSGSGKPWAEVHCVLDGVKTVIKRTYRPNTLTVRQKKTTRGVSQEQLEDLLRLNSSMFQSSIVIGQFSQMFFDRKPMEKLSIFTDLLGLDYWLDCSKHASDTASELEKDHDGLRYEVVEIRSTVAEIKRTIVEDEKEAGSFEEENRRQRWIAALQMLSSHAELLRLDEAIRLTETHFQAVAHQAYEVRERIEKIEERMDDYKATIAGYDSSIAEQRAVLSSINRQRDKLKKVKSKCPTCGQRIDTKHRDVELGSLDKQERAVKRELRELQQDQSLVRRKLRNADEKRERLYAQLEEQEQPADVKRDLELGEHDVAAAQRRYKDGRADLRALRRATNKYANRVLENQRRVNKMKNQLVDKKREMKELEGMIKEVRYWVRGFKDIRLLEIDEALTALQLEVNNYLADLGMHRWTVRLDVERETKKGTVQRGFHVVVDPGTGKKDIKPWEAWSGGEGQRLRLAGTKALANLIMRQNNRVCNLQVWDEKLMWLSGNGEQDMLELLHETAKREGKQIWLVDQHNLDYPFDDVVTVVKDKSGSHIVQGWEK